MNLKEEIESFKANPTPDGKTLKGRRRTSVKLMIPNLTFNEIIEMGSNVWIYLGENYECYCLYEKEDWCGKGYSFYSNIKCEYFPCHQIGRPEDFNCIFCYCPLFALGSACGGNFKVLGNGIKDCSDCMVPHTKESYGYIIKKFSELLQDTEGRARMEAPEIFRVLGKRQPDFVQPYLDKLQFLAEKDSNRVVRIHLLGAIKAYEAQ